MNTLLAFTLLEVSLCLVPGPAVLYVTGTALRRGSGAGMAGAAGILAGNAVYFALSALGVAAVLQASHELFTVLKWLGATYLAYIGLRALLAREAPVLDGAAASASRTSQSFAGGLLTQLANPKALVFFVAVLPQFIDPRRPAGGQLLVLCVIGLAVELSVLCGYVLAASRLRSSGAASRTSLLVERVGGGILLAVAGRVAAEPSP